MRNLILKYSEFGSKMCSFPVPQIQRNLQLRIEEQGKYLQMMFEKQNSSLTKGTASTSDAAAKSEQEDKITAGSKELAAEETRICEEPESPQPKRPKTDN